MMPNDRRGGWPFSDVEQYATPVPACAGTTQLTGDPLARERRISRTNDLDPSRAFADRIFPIGLSDPFVSIAHVEIVSDFSPVTTLYFPVLSIRNPLGRFSVVLRDA